MSCFVMMILFHFDDMLLIFDMLLTYSDMTVDDAG
jgi:hypothetical protein